MVIIFQLVQAKVAVAKDVSETLWASTITSVLDSFYASNIDVETTTEEVTTEEATPTTSKDTPNKNINEEKSTDRDEAVEIKLLDESIANTTER